MCVRKYGENAICRAHSDKIKAIQIKTFIEQSVQISGADVEISSKMKNLEVIFD